MNEEKLHSSQDSNVLVKHRTSMWAYISVHTRLLCTCTVGQCCKLGWGKGRVLRQRERTPFVAREMGRYSGQGQGHSHTHTEDREDRKVQTWRLGWWLKFHVDVRTVKKSEAQLSLRNNFTQKEKFKSTKTGNTLELHLHSKVSPQMDAYTQVHSWVCSALII